MNRLIHLPHAGKSYVWLFLLAYTGFVFPSIVVGFIADKVGIIPALHGFLFVVIILSIVLAFSIYHKLGTISK